MNHAVVWIDHKEARIFQTSSSVKKTQEICVLGQGDMTRPWLRIGLGTQEVPDQVILARHVAVVPTATAMPNSKLAPGARFVLGAKELRPKSGEKEFLHGGARHDGHRRPVGRHGRC